MKTVNVNITIQLDIEDGSKLIRVQEGLDFINEILKRESEDYNAYIFLGSVENSDITEMKDGIPVEDLLPFAVNFHDGREEYWDYFNTEEVARTLFETYRENREDAHLYKLTDNNEYEVIDSTWDESWLDEFEV